MLESLTIRPVAVAHTPFNEKFAIPRQANLVEIPASIELLKPFNKPEAVAGLEGISHIWLTFVFDRHLHDQNRPSPRLSIRPPRLGGNKKIGVFASRSSFRPNALGQSVVRLDKVICEHGRVILHVSGIDLLDQTAIIDIKPYVPYADAIDHAINPIADAAPVQRIAVQWQDDALQVLQGLKADWQQHKTYIEQLVGLDPRPAYKRKQADGCYAMAVFNLDVHWQMNSPESAGIIAVNALS
ncbi:MAG: tRNA (N6-threonylcarbamoyladenosine(37)-N6)-methyltransferase TrmO [Pseudomonadales bacterium]|nr:tRNA (N6-threonylcarbamoyladenosine(37)-N6)-methyltransferase TrmO [Pseudomonadales bacterium]